MVRQLVNGARVILSGPCGRKGAMGWCLKAVGRLVRANGRPFGRRSGFWRGRAGIRLISLVRLLALVDRIGAVVRR